MYIFILELSEHNAHSSLKVYVECNSTYSVAFSPQANYADQSVSACRRS
jgi:hypothetical protein